MNSTVMVREVFRVEDLGLDRKAAVDEVVSRFETAAEGEVARWIQFPRGLLLFVMAPDDPESGAFHVYDRVNGVFYLLDMTDNGKYGGRGLDELEPLMREHGLKRYAEAPERLRRVI
jgi:hypothetical protein